MSREVIEVIANYCLSLRSTPPWPVEVAHHKNSRAESATSAGALLK
jgi:hypothetical protein